MYIKFWKYKLQIIPTLFTIPTFIILLYLGNWQVQRLAEKNALLQLLNEKINSPTIDLPQITDNLSSLKYQKVKLKGKYLPGMDVFVYSGSNNSNLTDGFMLFTPLMLKDSRVIMVNRGWVPKSFKTQNNSLYTKDFEIGEVVGYIMLKENQGRFTPDNDLKNNIWFYVNLAEMREFIGLNIENFYVMRKYEGQDFPIGNEIDTNLRNPHLGYAITWYGAALALLVIFILYHKRINMN